MKREILVSAILLLSLDAPAQDVFVTRIKGLRVNGEGADRFPVAGLDSGVVLIEFDLDSSQPEVYRAKFYHCDKDWNVTQNSFVNDEMRNSTKFPIPFEVAPAGVQHYRYHYTLRVPGLPGIEKFSYSGNYIFEIWDQDQTTLLAKGRFFVAEHRVPFSVSIRNRYLPSTGLPFNQVNKVQFTVVIHDEANNEIDRIVPNLVRTADIYKNRELFSPDRIDVDDSDPNTFVDGLGTNNLTFRIDNVRPGNEYRHLDVTNVDFYPPNKLSRERNGADISRMFHQGQPDLNGQSIIQTNSQYSDYVKYQFELDRESDDLSPLYVVGDFNNWSPSDQWKFAYDGTTQRYILQAEFRRGIYDYQYVCNGNDWYGVEGNDWRTVNQFTVLLYYHDIRLGGIDRIIGIGQRLNPGGTEATTN